MKRERTLGHLQQLLRRLPERETFLAANVAAEPCRADGVAMAPDAARAGGSDIVRAAQITTLAESVGSVGIQQGVGRKLPKP